MTANTASVANSAERAARAAQVCGDELMSFPVLESDVPSLRVVVAITCYKPGSAGRIPQLSSDPSHLSARNRLCLVRVDIRPERRLRMPARSQEYGRDGPPF